jgi:hypothetical protein
VNQEVGVVAEPCEHSSSTNILPSVLSTADEFEPIVSVLNLANEKRTFVCMGTPQVRPPRVGDGPYGDMHSGQHHLRLFAHFEPTGWTGSVFDLVTKEWLRQNIWANNEEDAKCTADGFALPTCDISDLIDWPPGSRSSF